jgi:hypothetical protein
MLQYRQVMDLQESFEEVWYRLGHDFSDSYYSDRVDSVTVTGCLHLTFILQGGLDGARIGGCSHLLVVAREHRGL